MYLMNGSRQEYYDNGNLKLEGEYLNKKRIGQGEENGILFVHDTLNFLISLPDYKLVLIILRWMYFNEERNGKGKEYKKCFDLSEEFEVIQRILKRVKMLPNTYMKLYDYFKKNSFLFKIFKIDICKEEYFVKDKKSKGKKYKTDRKIYDERKNKWKRKKKSKCSINIWR